MGAKRGGDASEFWERYEQLKGDLQDKQIIMDAGIQGSSTLSMWKNRRIFPAADISVRVAKALNTTTEYLVTGEKPLILTIPEKALLDKALLYKDIIFDLDDLSAPVRNQLAGAIRGAAEEARATRMAETKGA